MCIRVCELGFKAVDSSSKPCYAPPAARCFSPAVWLVLSHMSALLECETWTHFRMRPRFSVPAPEKLNFSFFFRFWAAFKNMTSSSDCFCLYMVRLKWRTGLCRRLCQEHVPIKSVLVSSFIMRSNHAVVTCLCHMSRISAGVMSALICPYRRKA